MVSARRVLILVLCVAALAAAVCAEQMDNWPGPWVWSPPTRPAPADSGRALSAEGIAASQTYSPLPFIGLTPCRIADTRGNGFSGPYGPPSLPQGSPRNFTLGGQCGIPASAGAVSLNITVTNTQGPGFIAIYPQGAPAPVVSTLNYVAGQTIANAAVVPLGTGGGVTVVAGVSGTDLIIDTNGYYAGSSDPSSFGVFSTFLGNKAGNSTTPGMGNTGVGYSTLNGNTTGGDSNTALGAFALTAITTGLDNTASGYGALSGNNGIGNTANGRGALGNNTGSFNTAIGRTALGNNTTGNFNVAIGAGVGGNLTTGSNNIYIGSGGGAVASESTKIRIGEVQTATFIAGIRGVMTTNADAIPVLIDSAGQLGTASSSARAKEQIRDMGQASSALLELRPVTFHYKGQSQGSNPLHFGLIAEEVDEVLPELVVHRPTGEAETVLYHEMPAMLLNELQKQQRTIQRQQQTIEEQSRRIAQQEGEIKDLSSRFLGLEERVGMSAVEVSSNTETARRVRWTKVGVKREAQGEALARAAQAAENATRH